MEKAGELAEIIGIMLGDGNMYSTEKQKVYQIRIAGHIRDDKEYLLEWVKPLFENVFSVKVYTKIHNTHSEMFICVNSKKAFLMLEQYGFPRGNKKRNNVTIPEWIMDDSELLKRCIRGLIDTDGFIYPKTPKHKYPSIWFVSGIASLRNSFDKATHKLGFHFCKWTDKKSVWAKNGDIKQNCLGKSEEVIRFYKEIGFKNPKNINKFKNFCKAPVV